ncbi:hypothetical protein KXD97_28270 [Mycobacterium sp. SMC-8]|uniref:hypothetical protein n=1 Tax=Mycobacterium sp. SMC-8 TaxID=2857060 RepID=UPI0021B2FF57|nr:hypothetical protein [Mycobacterium sp. SMC-8]UXA11812.1 hypothetical protein KXD97_28270 [Mycobacterium sp. SMC-8]
MTDTRTFRIHASDGRGGIQNRGSVRVNRTADGVELNQIWDEIADALAIYNDQRSAISSLVSFRTIRPGDAVPQNVRSERFEEATEYGQPTGISDPDYLKLGFSIKDYDLGMRATWRYLRDATSEQLADRVTRIFAADSELVNSLVLQRLFTPTPVTNDQLLTCYGLWNGDGMKPPAHMGKTFAGDHTHYLYTNSTVLHAFNVENAIAHVREHGYGQELGGRFVLLIHPEDVEASGMTRWRAGQEYATGVPLPLFDFIVSSNAPAFLTSERVQGETPPPDYGGVPVLGSYGGALVIQSYFIPKGYCTVVASGGANSVDNAVGVREHDNSAYQGLRQIPGSGPYPLQDSFFTRTIGVGVRHRGAAVAISISNSAYAAPAFPAVP